MNCRLVPQILISRLLGCLLLFLGQPFIVLAEPVPNAVSAFNSYIKTLELRLDLQHRSLNRFIALPTANPEQAEVRLRHGELIIERLTPTASAEPSGALLHDWRGTAFAPGATAADFERLLRDVNSYPRNFAPQIVRAGVLTQEGNRMTAWMRVRQKHGITVVLDTTYDIAFGQLDPQDGYSASRSTRISEINSPGTSSERVLGASDEHGFLWRLDTYWSYEERDGGLYLQIESVSLTRAVPTGPYMESIPRESLEFTLRSACNALRK
jgi:hypothetical protein